MKANRKKNRQQAVLDMSSPEAAERFRKAAEAFTKRITRTRETARAALIAEGIYTKSGRLSKNYR